MIFAKIALGLLGLGIVVFVHELGHFLAARLVGIDVEAFSIGWGKPILKKKVGNVEYRLGMFPVGGYCKMRGQEEFKEAYENNANGIKPVKGTFYGAHPLKRIVACVAGPLFNLIFAMLVLSIVYGVGFERMALENRIILASEYQEDEIFPADEAGLKTGDRIIQVNRKKTNYHFEVQENIAVNPGKQLNIIVDSGGETRTLQVTPELDKNTGAGRIGVYFWTDTIIDGIIPGSLAANAGLLPGDIITAVNGEKTEHTIDFQNALSKDSEFINIEYNRNGITYYTQMEIPQEENAVLGIIWPLVTYQSPRGLRGMAKGITESWKTLAVSVKSLGILFKGINLTEAVSGPVRITYMVGDTATEGFGESVGTGLRSTANFLALISIALCIMNLLPLPILDGGLIIMFIIEIIRRKPLHPKAISVIQAVGIGIIAFLMIFALMGDIMYFARR